MWWFRKKKYKEIKRVSDLLVMIPPKMHGGEPSDEFRKQLEKEGIMKEEWIEEKIKELIQYGNVNTLVKIGELAVEPLIQALKNEDCRIRIRAATVLGKIGDTKAIQPLVQVLKDGDERVQASAAEALKKIEEQNPRT